MNIYSTIVALVLISFGIKAQEIELTDFDMVNVSGRLQVDLVKSDKNGASIKILRGFEDDVRLEVKENKLSIYIKAHGGGKYNSTFTNAKVTLYYKDLKRIYVSSGANIKNIDPLVCDSLNLNASVGGSMSLHSVCRSLEAKASSGGNIKIKGTADLASYKADSGGSIVASSMISGSTKVLSISGGNAMVYAGKEINASASSGGSVKYTGHPEKKNLDESKMTGGSIQAF